jgi:hypothetical protein
MGHRILGAWLKSSSAATVLGLAIETAELQGVINFDDHG